MLHEAMRALHVRKHTRILYLLSPVYAIYNSEAPLFLPTCPLSTYVSTTLLPGAGVACANSAATGESVSASGTYVTPRGRCGLRQLSSHR